MTTPTKRAPRPESKPEPAPPRLAYRLSEVADALGISRRSVERARSAGRFPKPDARVGKVPLWRPETLDAWLNDGGGHK